MNLPKCTRCSTGVWLPFSDYHHGGGAVEYKAWACNNSACRYGMLIDRGLVTWIRLDEVVEGKLSPKPSQAQVPSTARTGYRS